MNGNRSKKMEIIKHNSVTPWDVYDCVQTSPYSLKGGGNTA